MSVPGGGNDTITVNDLTGTDTSKVNIDLAAADGAPDGVADTVVINATEGSDAITISTNNGVVTVTGLAETVTISNFDSQRSHRHQRSRRRRRHRGHRSDRHAAHRQWRRR